MTSAAAKYPKCSEPLLSGFLQEKMPIPCRTFSVAQSRGGRAIRCKDHPRGTPGFHTLAELDRIKEGNHILDKSVALLKALNRLAIPYIIENPFTSYLWSDPGMQECLKKGRYTRPHQCAFGAKHRKNTCIVSVNF